METTDGFTAVITHAFVYGTLRLGGGNDVMMIGAKHVDWEASTSGRIYFAHAGWNGYPKAILSADYPERVAGDVWDISRMTDADWSRVVRMELGAGYNMTIVPVTLSNGETIRCVAFSVPDSRGLGDRIESGDWKTAVAEAYKTPGQHVIITL